MILAFIGAILTGLILGLLGSGGSIMTIPILVYFLNRPEKTAIAESLFIVGMISFSGAIFYGLRSQIDWKAALFFGLPAIIGSFLGACCSGLVSGNIQMLLFSFILFAASWVMFKKPIYREKAIDRTTSNGKFCLQGLLIGGLTGLIGCGGGFIIVPALVVFRNLSMVKAVGTSLVVITMTCLTGFFKQSALLNEQNLSVDWSVVFMFSCLGILGGMTGTYLSKYFTQVHLKKIFAWAVFLMACLIFEEQIRVVFYT